MANLFPDPREASPEGLVAVGGPLTVEALLEAYSNGIFPWPHEGYPMLWFSPNPRGVIDFAEFHIPKSLAKFARQKSNWRFTVNAAFEKVIQQCRDQKRPGQASTWITPSMVMAYQRLFAAGHVLSVEVWEEDELVGGIYGVLTAQYFSAESMFYKKDNASKLALCKLVEELRKRELTWMDVQMVTPTIAALGGKYIDKEEFLQRIGVD